MGIKTRISLLGRHQAVDKSSPPSASPSGSRTEEKPAAPTAAPSQEAPESPFKPISTRELEWAERLQANLLTVMDLALLSSLDEKQVGLRIRETGQRLLLDMQAPLNEAARQRVAKLVEDEILGLGPLEPLMAEPTVSDILVNGHDQIYVERRGKLELTPIGFRDNDHLMRIIDRIVSGVGRRVDESSPMVDARLKDGSRINAIIPPLALNGPVLSIRRFAADVLQMEQLICFRALTPAIAEVLQAIVKARLNIIVSGGTGTGKTTMLNVLSSFIPSDERIITIEDSAELQLRQPHVVRLETRPPNVEGKGQITQRDLVRNSLRMRPDRIILGEVRQGEAFDMLQAMNTGHDGSLATVHANTPRDAITRVENMVMMAGLDLGSKAVRTQIASAIDVVLQLERMEDGRRKLVSVQEVDGMEGDIITMTEIFRFQRQDLDKEGNVVGTFKATGLIPKFYEKLQKRGIMINRNVFDPDRKEEWEQ